MSLQDISLDGERQDTTSENKKYVVAWHESVKIISLTKTITARELCKRLFLVLGNDYHHTVGVKVHLHDESQKVLHDNETIGPSLDNCKMIEIIQSTLNGLLIKQKRTSMQENIDSSTKMHVVVVDLENMPIDKGLDSNIYIDEMKRKLFLQDTDLIHLVHGEGQVIPTFDYSLPEFKNVIISESRKSLKEDKEQRKELLKLKKIAPGTEIEEKLKPLLSKLKGLADREIKRVIADYITKYYGKLKVILLSSDVDFVKAIFELEMQYAVPVLLVHKENTNEVLKRSASNSICISDIKKAEIPLRQQELPGSPEPIVYQEDSGNNIQCGTSKTVKLCFGSLEQEIQIYADDTEEDLKDQLCFPVTEHKKDDIELNLHGKPQKQRYNTFYEEIQNDSTFTLSFKSTVRMWHFAKSGEDIHSKKEVSTEDVYVSWVLDTCKIPEQLDGFYILIKILEKYLPTACIKGVQLMYSSPKIKEELLSNKCYLTDMFNPVQKNVEAEINRNVSDPSSTHLIIHDDIIRKVKASVDSELDNYTQFTDRLSKQFKMDTCKRQIEVTFISPDTDRLTEKKTLFINDINKKGGHARVKNKNKNRICVAFETDEMLERIKTYIECVYKEFEVRFIDNTNSEVKRDPTSPINGSSLSSEIIHSGKNIAESTLVPANKYLVKENEIHRPMLEKVLVSVTVDDIDLESICKNKNIKHIKGTILTAPIDIFIFKSSGDRQEFIQRLGPNSVEFIKAEEFAQVDDIIRILYLNTPKKRRKVVLQDSKE